LYVAELGAMFGAVLVRFPVRTLRDVRCDVRSQAISGNTMDMKKAIAARPRGRLCVLSAAAEPSSEQVKELRAKGEVAFVEEAGNQADMW
jgi:hypothetical protein